MLSIPGTNSYIIFLIALDFRYDCMSLNVSRFCWIISSNAITKGFISPESPSTINCESLTLIECFQAVLTNKLFQLHNNQVHVTFFDNSLGNSWSSQAFIYSLRKNNQIAQLVASGMFWELLFPFQKISRSNVWAEVKIIN